MLDVAFGVIVVFFAFAAIGFGPALFLLENDKRIEVVLSIAPALGFALTSVFGTWLILLQKPVSDWAMVWLVFSMLVSITLSLIASRKRGAVFHQIDRHLISFFAVGLLVTVLFVTAPMVVGGSNFTILRGNGTDTINYMTMAEYLDREPYSWAFQVDTQTLTDRHPLYELARQLLSTRWTTSAMLAWTARVASIPISRFEYGFTILCFILIFGPAFIYALFIKLPPAQASLLAVAICVGFWAQFVLDIRAMSQMNSISIVMLLSLLLVQIEENTVSSAVGEHVLLAISAIALVYLYWEIVPMVGLGVLIFVGIRLFRKSYSLRRSVLHLATLIVTIVGVLPILPSLGRFFINAILYATTAQNTWHQAYFTWLYSNPFTGLWGLSYLSKDRGLGRLFFVPGLLKVCLIILGIMLTFVLIFLMADVFSFKKKRAVPTAVSLAAAFMTASFFQFFFLLFRGQLWAAGKGLSFGYPFTMLMVTGFALVVIPMHFPTLPKTLLTGAKYCILVWIIIQCALGIYRTGYAYAGKDYKNYIVHNANYRNHDWNFDPFIEVLNKKSKPTVWVSSEIYEYIGLMLGRNVKLLNIDRAAPEEMSGHLPPYLLINKKSLKTDVAPNIVAQNSELLLIDIANSSKNNVMLLGLSNPNNLESNSNGSLQFWMGGEATSFKLISLKKGDVVFRAKFRMGPSLPERHDRKLEIQSSAIDMPLYLTVSEFTREIRVPVHEAFNMVTVKILDRPTIPMLPNGDPRPLLLHVDSLELEFSPS